MRSAVGDAVSTELAGELQGRASAMDQDDQSPCPLERLSGGAYRLVLMRIRGILGDRDLL